MPLHFTDASRSFGESAVYITTTLPYINAKPHVGFAMEFVRADVLARYAQLRGREVFFNTGTDEHGQKIYESAKEKGVEVQEYCDGLAEEYKKLIPLLGITEDVHFIRTTDAHHLKAAQHFWKLVDENGYIEKRAYSAKYCVGCELEKKDSELVDGKCPLHPSREIEIVDEENYFFLFSKFTQKLQDLYASDSEYVMGPGRFKEIKSFVQGELQDFSISRLKTKMPWGIPVPGDSDHVMYVWFDALVNYVSTLGWPEDTENFEKYWEHGQTFQYAGKDNLRQQTAMWQAMLMAAGLPTTKKIRINGFINGSGGVKMSKSLGNVISPFDVVEKYGTDALRYFLLRHIPAFEDGEMSMEMFHEYYTAHLVNGLGNLASRILNLSEKYLAPQTFEEVVPEQEFVEYLENGEFGKALDLVWKKIDLLNEYISEQEPFKVIKVDEQKGREVIRKSVAGLYSINEHLSLFLPATYAMLHQYIVENKKPEIGLFPRLLL